MEIKDKNYSIWHDKTTKTVIFQGSLRLSGSQEYAPIAELLNSIARQEPPTITLDLRELKFLNSSGINLLSKFVIDVRNKKNIQIIVIGSTDIRWQEKSLKNLQRLMPSLKLELA